MKDIHDLHAIGKVVLERRAPHVRVQQGCRKDEADGQREKVKRLRCTFGKHSSRRAQSASLEFICMCGLLAFLESG